MYLSITYKPIELLVSLLTTILSLQKGVQDTTDVFVLEPNQFRQNNLVFTKNEVDDTHENAIKFCRARRMELLVPTNQLKIRDIFEKFGVQEAWTHLKRMDDQVLEATTLYQAVTDTADGVILIPGNLKIDSDNFPTIKVEKNSPTPSLTFGTASRTTTKPTICFQELLFPNRESDTAFFQDSKKEMLRLIDITVDNIKNSKKLISSMSKLSGAVSDMPETELVPSEVDLQQGISGSLKTLGTDIGNFQKMLGPIADRNDAELRDLRLRGVLALAENIREDILVPWLNPAELLPETTVIEQKDNKNAPFLTDLNKILFKIGTNQRTDMKMVGMLPNNTPNDFYDVSFVDILYGSIGLIVALTSGAMKTMDFIKKRRGRQNFPPNMARPPPGYPLRVLKMTAGTHRTEPDDYTEDEYLHDRIIVDHRRTLPRNANAVPLIETVRECRPVRPAYEVPLWRS